MNRSNDGPVGVSLEPPGLLVEPADRAELLVIAELRFLDGASSAPRSSCRRPWSGPGRDGGPCRHGRARSGPGSAKRQGAPWITSATIASERTVRAPTPGTRSSSGKVLRALLGRRGEGAVEAADHDVAGADVMMVGHDQMGEERRWWPKASDRARAAASLGTPGIAQGRASRASLSGPRSASRVELGVARGFGAAVGEVDDLALPPAPSIAAWGASTKLSRPSDSQ